MLDATFTLEDLGLLDLHAPCADLSDVTSFVAALTYAPVALVSIVQPERDRQFFAHARGLPEPWASRRETPLSHSFCRLVRETGAPLIVTNAHDDDRVKNNGAVADLGVVAYLGAPIHGPDSRVIGALCAIDGQPRAWTDGELENLSRLAAFVDDKIRLRAALRARTLQHAMLAAEIDARKEAEANLRALAMTDALTALPNRRAFIDRAETELARLRRYGDELSVLMIDLDHFKAVNDRYGHTGGDAVLGAVAARLQSAVRAEVDVMARLGGEEFAALLPQTARLGALAAAERCRAAIAGAPIRLESGDEVWVTASVGVARSEQYSTSLDGLISAADQALYMAKALGRNRVVDYETLGAEIAAG